MYFDAGDGSSLIFCLFNFVCFQTSDQLKTISKDKLKEGIRESCSLLLFLNSEYVSMIKMLHVQLNVRPYGFCRTMQSEWCR